MNAGQALQRTLLTSATCGVAAALHSQPVEVSWLREAIRTQLGDGSYPQLVLRLGTVIQNAISIRRPAQKRPDDRPQPRLPLSREAAGLCVPFLDKTSRHGTKPRVVPPAT